MANKGGIPVGITSDAPEHLKYYPSHPRFCLRLKAPIPWNLRGEDL